MRVSSALAGAALGAALATTLTACTDQGSATVTDTPLTTEDQYRAGESSAPPESVTPTPPPPAPAEPAALGTAFRVTGSDYVDGADVPTEVEVIAESAQTVKAEYTEPNFGRYVRVVVNYTGVTGSVSFYSYDWSVQAPDGTRYRATSTSAQTGVPELPSGELAPGAKARGYMDFDVPADAPTLTLVYTPTLQVTGPQAMWTLPTA